MSLRLYRRWKERRSWALDRYDEMTDEQREAIDRYQHRPKVGLPALPMPHGTPAFASPAAAASGFSHRMTLW